MRTEKKKQKEGKAAGSFPLALPQPFFRLSHFPKIKFSHPSFQILHIFHYMFYKPCCKYQPFDRKDIWKCNSCCSFGRGKVEFSVSSGKVKILQSFTPMIIQTELQNNFNSVISGTLMAFQACNHNTCFFPYILHRHFLKTLKVILILWSFVGFVYLKTPKVHTFGGITLTDNIKH